MSEPSGITHFSVEVEGLETHRIARGRTLSRVVEMEEYDRQRQYATVESRSVLLLDVDKARAMQQAQLDSPMGGPITYYNSCSTAVCDVIHAGGVDVPERQLQHEFLGICLGGRRMYGSAA